MLTRSGLGNEFVSCLQSNDAEAKDHGVRDIVSRAACAILFVLVLWLVATGPARAASGTPWHTQADVLTGEVLALWELWSKSLIAETWTDEQQTWVESSLPWLISPHPTSASSALAAGPFGVYRTTDGGETWAHLPGIVDPVIAIDYNAQNPQIVYAGTELDGTYRSENGGLYWRSINNGFPRDRLGNVIGAVYLAADPVQSNTLFAATTTAGGLYRTLDDGATWLLSNSGLPEESILGLAITDSSTPKLYAAMVNGLYLSSDRSEAWTLVGELPADSVQELIHEPQTLGTLLLVTESAIYRTTNGGVSWVSLDLPAEMGPIGDVMFTRSSDYTYLFVASENGPFWQRFSPVTPQSPPQAESETEIFVSVTGHTIRQPFLAYFNTHGGVVRFGYPRTDAISEDGKTVQYFQRSRFEVVTEDGEERVVQTSLSRLLRGESSSDSAQSSSGGDEPQFAVGQVFASFYANNNGAETIGSPIAAASDEEQLNGVTLYTQYFEFARLEFHPDTASPVLLGLIGDEYLIQRGWME
jgi:hypothetical protein